MGKIKGKFAPLFERLGSDERFIVKLSDFEKFIYILVLATIYWNNNSAPEDPRYYQVRYGLRSRRKRIGDALEAVKSVYPSLICKDKKLSLSSYVACDNRVALQQPQEGEKEAEKDEKAERPTTLSFKSTTNAKPLGRDYSHESRESAAKHDEMIRDATPPPKEWGELKKKLG